MPVLFDQRTLKTSEIVEALTRGLEVVIRGCKIIADVPLIGTRTSPRLSVSKSTITDIKPGWLDCTDLVGHNNKRHWEFDQCVFDVAPDVTHEDGIKIASEFNDKDVKWKMQTPNWSGPDWGIQQTLKDKTLHQMKPEQFAAQAAPNWSKPAQSLSFGLADITEQLTVLARALWSRLYKEQSPNWHPEPDIDGLISQIDNMTAELISPDQIRSILKELLDDLRTEICANFRDLAHANTEIVGRLDSLAEQVDGVRTIAEIAEAAACAAFQRSDGPPEPISPGESISRAKDQTFKPRPFSEKY